MKTYKVIKPLPGTTQTGYDITGHVVLDSLITWTTDDGMLLSLPTLELIFKKYIEEPKNIKKPLFKDKEGVNIYTNDQVYYVRLDGVDPKVVKTIIIKADAEIVNKGRFNYPIFKNKEKAEEYFEEHIKQFSLNNIRSRIKDLDLMIYDRNHASVLDKYMAYLVSFFTADAKKLKKEN
jgi:hypothetical protein